MKKIGIEILRLIGCTFMVGLSAYSLSKDVNDMHDQVSKLGSAIAEALKK